MKPFLVTYVTNDDDKERTALDEANDLELIIAALSSVEQDKNKKFRGHCNPWNPLYRHQDGHSRERIRNQILPNTSMAPAIRSTLKRLRQEVFCPTCGTARR